MEIKNNSKSNVLYLIGLIAIGLEFFIYLITRNTIFPNFFSNEKMFFIFTNHAITLAYLIAIIIHSMVKSGWKFMRMDKRLFISFISLAYISAHSLNEEIAIFSRYPTWLNVLLISIFVCLHLIDYLNKMPEFIRPLIFFILGFGTIVIFYFSVYLAPFLPIGIIGLVFFGLTIYLFTPLILLIILIYHFFKTRQQKPDTRMYIAGLVLPLILTMFFLVKWQKTENQIETTLEQIYTDKHELPEWLILGQHLPTDKMTRKVISSNLCYDNLKYFGRWSNSLSSTIGENITHDPLVIVAQLLFGEFSLDDDVCLKIIEYQYDARHEVYRKLWTGRDLETKQVISDIQVYPDYRLAYTEKTITIRNNNRSEWSDQEALYTFKLPEGSVASSLSLWINGKEEKSRLSTKEKADSAYTSIVGFERRDPALLHWQEGNTITVTIFPCNSKEDRIFKIGITSPLKLSNNQLILENISFKGPNFLWAKEISTIEFFSDNNLEIDVPSDFQRANKNKYVYKGSYNEDKKIQLKAPKLSAKSFSFNNKSYSIKDLVPSKVSFNPGNIYLDINKSWTKDEFEQIFRTYSGKQIFVYNNKLVQLNKENKNELFHELNSLNFSIFPLFKIDKPANSLLISKSTKNSAYLKDFKETKFGSQLEIYLHNSENLKLANIGTQLSPYLKSLKEFGIFEYWNGSIDELLDLNKKQIFPISKPTDNSTAFDISNSRIVMQNHAAKSEAPDHLMRLFAYNQIMKFTGRNYFNNNAAFQESLIHIANKAYVVSPVSSLVVLETLKDYERFDIGENENSLENAAKNSSGAVPEPHEWALIVLTILVVTFLYYKRF